MFYPLSILVKKSRKYRSQKSISTQLLVESENLLKSLIKSSNVHNSKYPEFDLFFLFWAQKGKMGLIVPSFIQYSTTSTKNRQNIRHFQKWSNLTCLLFIRFFIFAKLEKKQSFVSFLLFFTKTAITFFGTPPRFLR